IPRRDRRSISSPSPHCGHFTPVGLGGVDLPPPSLRMLRQAGKPEQENNGPWRPLLSTISLPHSSHGGCGSVGMLAFIRRGSFVCLHSGEPGQAKNWPKRERLSCLGFPH